MCLKQIKKYLASNINISHIEIYNDSKSHKYAKNTLTHITIIIISDDFVNKKTTDRHRLIFKILYEIHKKNIYSITLYTYTLNEWKYKKYNIDYSSKCFQKIL
ncbi:BolA/IbaG family iron-sulfur metabolism protein [Buchnera aphidicola (Aphis fabae)]|uniref:BolA/IbaG family iron-sulfur metabolism protein n=1 Tax=Buchnera aphidicola (Aphis fabae) TaxID=571430 RepID=A0A5J6ZD15_9GAMM|nr:BolA/IbaG family iron-sulfur metabolism protein [Buchnera aphidicola]QFQ32628.1 BolA/IbaG family iron-sulfur metabolism protein [Buchnera aphidicola (Aphis fabae)]